ncbi:MAG: glycosyltransferase family 4 protein [Flavobacteriales bacterium]
MSSNPIKVCHFTSVHKRYDVRILRKQCQSISKSFQIYLVVADGLGNEEVNGVKIIDVGKAEAGRFKRFLKTSKRVSEKALSINADIYHFHDPELLFYSKRFLKMEKKLIYDAHEDVPRQILSKYWIPGLIRKLVSYAFEKFENYKSSKMSYIVTATPFIRDRFIKLNKNTIDINNFPLTDVIINDSEIDFKENAVCYIGGITKIRGVEELVKSLEFVQVKLKLAGEISPAAFEERLKALKSWDKVDFLGFVGRDDIRSILKSSKIGIVTLHPIENYIDALPVKMFEYMAAGLPVIASHFPLWQNILESNNCGICVNPESPEEIANAIQFLLDNPKQAKQMGINGRNAVQDKYNWNIEEAKLIKMYKSLLS